MIKLGGNTFDVPAPRAMKSFAFQQTALPVAGRIVSVFFHVLGMSPSSNPGDLLGVDVTKVLPQALPLIGEVFAAMPAGELDKITRTLLGEATTDGIKLFGTTAAGDHFDGLMVGRTEDTWQLLWHALGVWYPDFFTRAKGLFAKGVKEKASAA